MDWQRRNANHYPTLPKIIPMTLREKNMATLQIGTVGKKTFIKLNNKLYPLAKDWKRIFALNIDKEEWDPTWLLSPRNRMQWEQDRLKNY